MISVSLTRDWLVSLSRTLRRRGAIIELARAGEVDDVLLVMINSNGDNARDSGDPGRANFLYKLAEVCVREKKAAEGEW